MNLVADMLLHNLRQCHAETVVAARLVPPMRRLFTRGGTSSGQLFKADRALNRFWDYPRGVRRRRSEFDLFHVVDHSYAQLVHQLPAGRTVVTCHDLDTFRCLLEPESERRSRAFRLMTGRVLEGFRRAARVACDSAATRDELLAHGLLPPGRLAVIPNGVHPAFTSAPDAEADAEAERLLGGRDGGAVELLHVGSTVARKRVDVLLRAFAEVRRRLPGARLVRVGGEFTPGQAALAGKLKLRDALRVLPPLETPVLAAVYRRAALVLQPSEREGFGLPVVEALACGTHVVASSLPVLREVGGPAATYCPVGDAGAWAEAVVNLVREREDEPARWAGRREAGINQASKFTWGEYVAKTVSLYTEVLEQAGSRGGRA